MLCECITCKQYDNVVQRFFNSGDEDADNEVADADETTPASCYSRCVYRLTTVMYDSSDT